MKFNERSITRTFLENAELNNNTFLKQDDTIDAQEDFSKAKKEASTLLDKNNDNSKNYGVEASKLLNKVAATPQSWSSIYKAIEDFRTNVRMRDKFDTTANPSQIGMASVLHVLFSLVVETNLLIEPIDTSIIINTFKNNFTSQEQVEALEKLVNSLT